MREAELREQQVRAWEARAKKDAEAVRVRTKSQSQNPAVPLVSRVFSKEVWQQKPRPAVSMAMAPRREAKVRA